MSSLIHLRTDKGYRLYVDTMMEEKVEEVNTMRDQLAEKSDRIESLLQQVVKLLAVNTNYATMISTPKYRSRKVKFIQLTEVDPDHILAVILLEGNIPKNKIIPVSESVTTDVVLKLNLILNTFLVGLDLEEINIGVVQKMKEQAGEHTTLVGDILDAVASSMEEEGQIQVYTSGATNLFKYPELTDTSTARELLYTLEDKQQLTELMDEKLESGGDDSSDRNSIQVYIGGETPIDSMKDCSVVTATYRMDEGVYGKVGIIGPKRMDYEKVVATLKNLMSDLDSIFNKNNERKQ